MLLRKRKTSSARRASTARRRTTRAPRPGIRSPSVWKFSVQELAGRALYAARSDIAEERGLSFGDDDFKSPAVKREMFDRAAVHIAADRDNVEGDPPEHKYDRKTGDWRVIKARQSLRPATRIERSQAKLLAWKHIYEWAVF